MKFVFQANSYVDKRPKKLIKLSFLIFGLFTVCFTAILFLYKPVKMVHVNCRILFRDAIISESSVTTLIVAPELHRYRFQENKLYSIRWVSIDGSNRKHMINAFIDKTNTRDTFQIRANKNTAVIEAVGVIDGSISVPDKEGRPLIQLLTH